MMVVIMGTIVSYISIIGLNSGTAIDLQLAPGWHRNWC